jgi:predicted nicotinamide N-methyase
VLEDLVTLSVDLPGGALSVLQPAESAELPDDGGVEWAPLVPYWSVLWRSGVELARAVDESGPRGLRVVELGCGLGLPSLAAARAGATVLATDVDPDALALLERNARANGVEVETAVVDWTEPAALLERAPFDLVLAADVVYERESVEPLLALLPRLAPAAWVASPQRAPASAFRAHAGRLWQLGAEERGVVELLRLRLG